MLKECERTALGPTEALFSTPLRMGRLRTRAFFQKKKHKKKKNKPLDIRQVPVKRDRKGREGIRLWWFDRGKDRISYKDYSRRSLKKRMLPWVDRFWAGNDATSWKGRGTVGF